MAACAVTDNFAPLKNSDRPKACQFQRGAFMSKFIIAVMAVSAVILSACAAEQTAPADPHRQEMINACPEKREYKSRDPERVKRYCGCVYDNAMKGLSEAEQSAAKFYLLGQTTDIQNRPEFKTMDLDAMGPASEAIGKAVEVCRL